MAKKRFSIVVDEEDIDALDSMAESIMAKNPGLELDRAKMVRMAIRDFVGGEREVR